MGMDLDGTAMEKHEPTSSSRPDVLVII